MKASKSSDAQEAFILEQSADGAPVAEIRREAGIGRATCFGWKKRYDGLPSPGMRGSKRLEDEDAEPREPVADPAPDREMPRDAIRRKPWGLGASASPSTNRVGRVDPLGLRGPGGRHLHPPP